MNKLSTTKIYSDLFKDNGSGEELKNSIVPLATDTSDSSTNVASTQWVNEWYESRTLPGVFFIDPVNGSDSNTGTTSNFPLKTVSCAMNIIKTTKNPLPLEINIYLAEGTYSEPLDCDLNGTHIIFCGPSTSGFASFTRLVATNSRVRLLGRIQFRSTFSVITRGASVSFGNGAYIDINNLSATYAFRIYVNSNISVFSGDTATLNFSGTNTFSSTIGVQINSSFAIIGSLNVTTSGTVTGKRYLCERCSGIYGSGSTSKFPGSQDGTCDSTSYYN